MKGISVIIPAYNEGDHIFNNLLSVAKTMSQSTLLFEIILVDDGSTDTTAAAAHHAAQKNNAIHVISYQKNMGKGAAFKKGVAASSYDEVVLFDADLDYHPDHILRLHYMAEQTEADIIIGSKFHTESVIDYPPLRRVLSKIFVLLAKTLFRIPFHDTQSGLKLFKRNVLDTALTGIESKGFAFDLELLLKAKDTGFRIVESPVELHYQQKKKCIPFTMILNLAGETLRIWFRRMIR